jgi:hypothetical protein
MPRGTALLELADDVIGDRVALGLGEPLPEPTHYLAGSAKCKGDGALENRATGHART